MVPEQLARVDGKLILPNNIKKESSCSPFCFLKFNLNDKLI